MARGRSSRDSPRRRPIRPLARQGYGCDRRRSRSRRAWPRPGRCTGRGSTEAAPGDHASVFAQRQVVLEARRDRDHSPAGGRRDTALSVVGARRAAPPRDDAAVLLQSEAVVEARGDRNHTRGGGRRDIALPLVRVESACSPRQGRRRASAPGSGFPRRRSPSLRSSPPPVRRTARHRCRFRDPRSPRRERRRASAPGCGSHRPRSPSRRSSPPRERDTARRPRPCRGSPRRRRDRP